MFVFGWLASLYVLVLEVLFFLYGGWVLLKLFELFPQCTPEACSTLSMVLTMLGFVLVVLLSAFFAWLVLRRAGVDAISAYLRPSKKALLAGGGLFILLVILHALTSPPLSTVALLGAPALLGESLAFFHYLLAALLCYLAGCFAAHRS